MLSLLSAASGFNAPLSSRVAAPTRAAAPVMDNSWRKSFDGRGGVGATPFASRTVASPAHLGCRTTHRLWPPPQTAGAPLAHHTPLACQTDRSRAAIFARSLAGGSQGGIALEMGVPEACKYFMKVTAAGLSTSDAAAYLISEKGVSKMTVAQALCTAETMDPKFGAVQGHP